MAGTRHDERRRLSAESTDLRLLAPRGVEGRNGLVGFRHSHVEAGDGRWVHPAVFDIDPHTTTEDHLLQQQKLESIGRLAGGIAHDFNNMLFVVKGYAEILAKDLASGDPARLDPVQLLQSVEAISQAADRAAQLTAQLLAFSRQQIVTVKVFDINAAIGRIEPMLTQLIGENIRLRLRLDPDAGSIRADPGQIEQVIVNLVVNARDALPSGGTITIETVKVALEAPQTVEPRAVTSVPFVLLAVIDDGVGMDRATRERIFEPFFTTKELGKGTGLGLASTYGVVQQAGGHIGVYSEPGHGSAFKLYFPRVDGIDEWQPPIPATAPVGVGTILLVEDEPAVRIVITKLLEQAGYAVVAVADGAGALDALRLGEPIDVLVTDVLMPNMSGIELAERVMDQLPSVGVVLLSGYTAEALDIGRVTVRGARHVPKPVSSNALLEAIHESASLRQAARRPQ